MKYNFWFPLKFEKFWSYFHKCLCILIWSIVILLRSYVIFVMILSLKGLQVLCSQYFQVLDICLSIARISTHNINISRRIFPLHMATAKIFSNISNSFQILKHKGNTPYTIPTIWNHFWRNVKHKNQKLLKKLLIWLAFQN